MAIPDYQTLMAPTLAALSDGQAVRTSAVRDTVAAQVGITEYERAQKQKGGSYVFDGRVNWAITYMTQAGLIGRVSRGVVQLTDRGREVLAENHKRIDVHLLERYEEFRDFRSRVRTPIPTKAESTAAVGATPRETIDAAVDETNAAVAADLLTRIHQQDPVFLERLVLRVLTAMGYGGAMGSAEHMGRSGDEGLDGVIRQDPLGLDRIYVQAKRYAPERAVGRPDIQGFVGALHGAQADRGVFITTSRFSQDAYDYADKVAARVILIDGKTLAALLVEHNIGVQDYQTYVIKRIDEDFFEDV